MKSSFETPAELERYFASDPDLGVAAKPDLISQCCRSFVSQHADHNEQIKASVAEYYTDMKRLNTAVQETLQGIAAIDSMNVDPKHKKPLLSGVDCSVPELKASELFCSQLRVSCQPQGGNFEVAMKTQQNLIEKKKLLGDIRWIKQNGDGAQEYMDGQAVSRQITPAQFAEVQRKQKRIQELEDDTPAIKDDSVAMKEINAAAKKSFDHNAENPENIARISPEVFSKASWDQNSTTRELLVKKLNNLKNAAKCLGGHGDCTHFDDLMESDDSTEIPYATIDPKMDDRTQRGLRAYNAGLCQSQARRKHNQHSAVVGSVTAAVGLTIAAGFFPPLLEEAGTAWAGAATTAAMNLYYLGDAVVDAHKSCQPKLDDLNKILEKESRNLRPFCPGPVSQPKAIALQSAYECEKGIAMIAPAAIPFVAAALKEGIAFSKAMKEFDVAEQAKAAQNLSPEEEATILAQQQNKPTILESRKDTPKSNYKAGIRGIDRVGGENIKVVSVQPYNTFSKDNHDAEFFGNMGAVPGEPDIWQLQGLDKQPYTGFRDDNGTGKWWNFKNFDRSTGKVTYEDADGQLLEWESGHRMDSQRVEFSVSGIGEKPHRIEMILPTNASPEWYAKDSLIVQTLENLPKEKIKLIDSIQVHTSELRGFPEAVAGVWEGESKINLYPNIYNSSSEFFMRSLIPHEFGHIIAFDKYGRTLPDSRWIKAIGKDTHVVSDYAATKPSEDFAETVRQYLIDNGSRRAGLEERYKILDEIFNHTPSLRQKMADLLRNIVFTGKGIAYFQGKMLNLFLDENSK